MHTRERQPSLSLQSGPAPVASPSGQRKAFEHNSTVQPFTTTATAHFFGGTKDGKPAVIDFDAADGHNVLPAVSAEVTVTDIRHFDPPCTLPVEGCHWFSAPTVLSEDKLAGGPREAQTFIQGTYFPECAEHVLRLTGAAKALPYQFRHRAMKPETVIADHNDVSTKPVQNFHVDNDDDTALRSLTKAVGEEEAKEWMKKRWGIINVWRPVGEPIKQWPLAIIDSTTLDFSDAVPVYTHNNYKNYTLLLNPKPDYNFYYVKDLAPDECLCFQNYERFPDGKRVSTAHGAFLDHSNSTTDFLRRSVEVRVLVCYDE